MTNTESAFEFYNRVDRPAWARVRDELELWYSEYRDNDGDLRKRFRNRRPDQHLGAWWELWVHTFYRRIGYEVAAHPTMPNGTRPDFVVTRGGASTYVECKAIPEEPRPAVEAWILDCTNKATHPDFMLELEIDQAGTSQPSANAIRTQLETWLNGLNADDVIDDLADGKNPPQCSIQVKDWRLIYTAYPVDRDKRGHRGRILGVPPSPGASFIDDIGLIRKALSSKGGKYTNLDAPLENPLIIAINTGSVFIADNDIHQALFGSAAFTYRQSVGDRSIHGFRKNNGYWRRAPPAGTRVSAVMMGRNIDPWGVAKDIPRMWVNPWAPTPISETHSLAASTASDDGQRISTEGTLAAHNLFGLPQDWPLVDKAEP